jgi:predicted amino acid racemase
LRRKESAMFLKQIMNRNPQLIRAAVELHQANRIPANTFVFDLDGVRRNAELLVREAKRNGLQSYLMTKHFNRNPFLSAVGLQEGFNGIVAVDMWCARSAHRAGNTVGHIGHLTQVPKRDAGDAVGMGPEVITVFSEHAAEIISEAATSAGRVQDILVRVRGRDDIFFTAQEGGVEEERLDEFVSCVKQFRGVRIVGVTSFPCLNYNLSAAEAIAPTPNLSTILRAAERLKSRHGIEVTQINAPGNNFTGSYKLLRDNGATHVEPGHAILGTTPSHAFFNDLPEAPCTVYVTEVSHFHGEEAYVFGGGFWVGARLAGNMASALVGRDFRSCMENELPCVQKPNVIIDYYGFLEGKGRCRPGDTAVFGFYSQVQMTRSYNAVVSGIRSGKPVLEGLFDHAGNLLDADGCAVGVEVVREKIARLRAGRQQGGN